MLKFIKSLFQQDKSEVEISDQDLYARGVNVFGKNMRAAGERIADEYLMQGLKKEAS